MGKHVIEVNANSAGYVWWCSKCRQAWAYCYANLAKVNGHCPVATAGERNGGKDV